MLQVVSINNHIIATSGPAVDYTTTNGTESLVGAADRLRDDWDAGY